MTSPCFLGTLGRLSIFFTGGKRVQPLFVRQAPLVQSIFFRCDTNCGASSGGLLGGVIRKSGIERNQRSMLAVNVGLGANIILAALKTGIGIAGNSPALLADGINSTSDVAYGIFVCIFVRLSGKSADHEHPYGHDQMESIAAVVVGAFVITTAIAIFWHSIHSAFDLIWGDARIEGAARITLWVALLTIGVKTCLAVWTRRVGTQTENTAVIALAHDHRNDIFASLAAAVGIFFGRMGHLWVDPLAGAVVSLVILHTGVSILRAATADLMDTVPGKALSRQIRALISPLEEVKEVEEIRAHRFGPYMVVNITIGVEGALTVSQGDTIASRVERLLLEDVDLVRRVYVHYHPARNSVKNIRGSGPPTGKCQAAPGGEREI